MTFANIIMLITSVVIAVGVVKTLMYLEDKGWKETLVMLTRVFLFCLLVGFIYLLIKGVIFIIGII